MRLLTREQALADMAINDTAILVIASSLSWTGIMESFDTERNNKITITTVSSILSQNNAFTETITLYDLVFIEAANDLWTGFMKYESTELEDVVSMLKSAKNVSDSFNVPIVRGTDESDKNQPPPVKLEPKSDIMIKYVIKELDDDNQIGLCISHEKLTIFIPRIENLDSVKSLLCSITASDTMTITQKDSFWTIEWAHEKGHFRTATVYILPYRSLLTNANDEKEIVLSKEDAERYNMHNTALITLGGKWYRLYPKSKISSMGEVRYELIRGTDKSDKNQLPPIKPEFIYNQETPTLTPVKRRYVDMSTVSLPKSDIAKKFMPEELDLIRLSGLLATSDDLTIFIIDETEIEQVKKALKSCIVSGVPVNEDKGNMRWDITWNPRILPKSANDPGRKATVFLLPFRFILEGIQRRIIRNGCAEIEFSEEDMERYIIHGTTLMLMAGKWYELRTVPQQAENSDTTESESRADTNTVSNNLKGYVFNVAHMQNFSRIATMVYYPTTIFFITTKDDFMIVHDFIHSIAGITDVVKTAWRWEIYWQRGGQHRTVVRLLSPISLVYNEFEKLVENNSPITRMVLFGSESHAIQFDSAVMLFLDGLVYGLETSLPGELVLDYTGVDLTLASKIKQCLPTRYDDIDIEAIVSILAAEAKILDKQ